MAYGEALLPPNVITAAATEAQGLMLAVMTSVATPRVVTDCKSLLAMASAGSASATSASTLAGTWTAISTCIDVDVRRLAEHGLLRWMPAHKSCAQAIRSRTSDGALITVDEWRANRLADFVARECARRSAIPGPAVARLLLGADGLRTEVKAKKTR